MRIPEPLLLARPILTDLHVAALAREQCEQELKRRAVVLLKNMDLSISEIAYLLGYHDASNFSRAFRCWTGKTPGEFRQRGG